MPCVNIGGEDLYYVERGAGRPLVLVHGFPLDGRIWTAQLEGLSDRYRVIVPDLRGFGQSRSTRGFTLDSLAADLHEMLTRLNALPCVLGGLSMGGYVSFAYVTKYPADLSGLIVVDSKPEADTAQGREGRLKMIQTARTGGSKAVADAMEPKMTAPNADPKVKAQLRRIMEECPPLTVEHASQAMHDRRDYRDELPSIALPMLVIVGDSDALIPVTLCDTVAKSAPRCSVKVILNSGHMTPMENPGAVNDAIQDFMG